MQASSFRATGAVDIRFDGEVGIIDNRQIELITYDNTATCVILINSRISPA